MKIADLAKKSMAVGFKQVMAEEIANHDAEGKKVNMAMIGAEAVSILVLIVIFMIIPFIGNAISEAMGEITSGAWSSAPNGSALWTTIAPILQTACIVVVVGLILKVIYDLRAGQRNE